MKGLFPEEYGLTGWELAAAAVVKFYVSEVEGARAELEGIMDNGSIDGRGLAAFIDRAVAYSKGQAQIEELQQVKGDLIVQGIGVDLLDFLMDCLITPARLSAPCRWSRENRAWSEAYHVLVNHPVLQVKM